MTHVHFYIEDKIYSWPNIEGAKRTQKGDTKKTPENDERKSNMKLSHSRWQSTGNYCSYSSITTYNQILPNLFEFSNKKKNKRLKVAK